MSNKQNIFNLMKLSKIIALSMSISSISTVAKSDGFNMISDDASLQQQYEESYFSQSGISGEEISPIVAAGADMPLALAVSLLVPKNWNIEASGDFQSAVVSWSGGVAWPHIMRNISQDEKIYITLDWIQKVAMINVPGITQSGKIIAQNNRGTLEIEKQDYQAKEARTWKKRDDTKVALRQERDKIQSFIEKQKEAQNSNQEFIASLNQTNEEFSRNNEKLENALALEKAEKQALIEKYAVIGINKNMRVEKVNATDLFNDHKDRWVLPFDSSFEYFLKGGHTDSFTYLTPATFVAKKGTVEEVVTEWATHLNWHVEYRAGVQHYNPYEVQLKGSFTESAVEMISIFKESKRPLDITFHPDVSIGNKKGLVTITDFNYERGQ